MNVFPTLHEIAGSMENNFSQWALRRIADINSAPPDAANPAATAEEEKKLNDRMLKFKEKMAFVQKLQAMPQRKRVSFQKK